MMSLLGRLRRPGAAPGEVTAEESIDAGMDLAANDARLKRQRIALVAAGTVLVGACGYWIMGEPHKAGDAGPKSGASGSEVKMATDELGGRNLAQKEWIATSENQLQTQDSRIRAMQGQGQQIAALEQQIQALRAENGSMANDGSRVVSAYESENQTLKTQLADAQARAVQAAAGPRALYGAGGPAAYQAPAGQAPGIANGGFARGNDIKVISFSSAGPGGGPGFGGTPPPKGTGAGAGPGSAMSVDSPNYLPANSFARARVIVGVDAPSNVQSQADPLPVVLRITGPARSVSDRGKVLMTRIEGCLVNGAARGDLSSEKVYVRLAKMTCPQPGGRFAESEVKGFIAFGGKTGVRGRVVSREGSLATQAFMAGLVGGIGRGFSANSQSFLQGATTIVNGQRSKLSASEIAQAGLGEGVSKAGDEVSQYLIERAEQYQPVIEMPTGIDVEIVFLEGVMVRN